MVAATGRAALAMPSDLTSLYTKGSTVTSLSSSYSQGGLMMNSQNGAATSPNVDWGTGQANLLFLDDPAQWHEFWITMQGDTTTGLGTHIVQIYTDGALTPATFHVTAGIGAYASSQEYNTQSVLRMALGDTAQSGAIDVDFFGYRQGVVAPTANPIPAPGAALLVFFGLACTRCWLRRETAP